MCEHTYCEMVEAGVGQRQPAPIWMDRYVKECTGKDAFVCMVTHKLCHPDRCLVGEDDVGDSNLSMKDDGHTGGKLLLTGQGSVPHARASRAEETVSMIGVTALGFVSSSSKVYIKTLQLK